MKTFLTILLMLVTNQLLADDFPSHFYNDHANKFTNSEHWARSFDNQFDPTEAKISEKYESVEAHGPILPVHEATYLSKADALTSLNFVDSPVDQVLSYYSEVSGMTTIVDSNVNATITFYPYKRYSIRETLILLRQILEIEGITVTPIDETTVRVSQNNE